MVNKQIFKGRTLYRKTTVDNILKVYNDDTFEFKGNWYKEAHKLSMSLANRHQLNYLQVSGIIAALSPLKSWEENKRITESFLKVGIGEHTAMLLGKAKEIETYNGDFSREFILATLNGNKISNFFLNIAFPKDVQAVTIDRHAIAVCLGRNILESEQRLTTNQYNFFLSCYVDASKVLNVIPNVVQSQTWEKWRALKAQKLNQDVPF